jgi:hypothetical protein
VIRSKRTMLTNVLLLGAAYCGDNLAEDTALIDVADLRIRDPFIVTVRDPQSGTCQTRHAAVRRRRSAGTVPLPHRRRCHTA